MKQIKIKVTYNQEYKLIEVVCQHKKHRLVYIQNNRGYNIYIFQKFKKEKSWVDKKMKDCCGFLLDRDIAIREFNKKYTKPD